MSLYHEAADILSSAREDNGSLKAIVFGKKTWKSNAKTLYALTTEATKWSDVLSEVIEKSGLLGFEKNVGALKWTGEREEMLTRILAFSTSGTAGDARPSTVQKGHCVTVNSWSTLYIVQT